MADEYDGPISAYLCRLQARIYSARRGSFRLKAAVRLSIKREITKSRMLNSIAIKIRGLSGKRVTLLSIAFSIIVLCPLFAFRQEYLVPSFIFLGFLATFCCVLFVFAFIRKERMILHLMHLEYGKDDGLRLFGLLFSFTFLLLFLIAVIFRLDAP